MRSARAARLSLELPLVLVSLLPAAPIVLPLLLLVSEELLLLAGGVLEELELLLGVLGDVVVLDDEPLAPIDVPLLLGELELDELVAGAELLLSLLLGVLVLLLGVLLLDPDAPMVLGVAGPPLAPGELLLLAPGELELLLSPGALLLPLLELWAMARPPNAKAAAAARAVRVVLLELMLNSLIDMLGNAPAMARRLKQD